MRLLSIITIIFFTTSAQAQINTVVCQFDNELEIRFIENEAVRQISYVEQRGNLVITIEFVNFGAMEWSDKVGVMGELCNGEFVVDFCEEYESEEFGIVQYTFPYSIAECIEFSDAFTFYF